LLGGRCIIVLGPFDGAKHGHGNGETTFEGGGAGSLFTERMAFRFEFANVMLQVRQIREGLIKDLAETGELPVRSESAGVG